MQIGSVSPDYSPSVTAQQQILPPIQPQPTSVQHKDKDGDSDGSSSHGADTGNSGRQVNVVA